MEKKRFVIALIAALVTNHAPAALLTFEEPGNIGGFNISGQIVDFGPTPYPYSFNGAYGGRMLASPSRALNVPRSRDGAADVERLDGGGFQLSSLVFAAAAVGNPTYDPRELAFGAALFIDGYRDGELLYHLETPVSAFARDNNEVPLVYEFDELVNVDRVSFYTTSYNTGLSLIDNLEYNLAAVAQEPVPSDPVPLPSTVALLALGLTGLAWRRYERKQRG